MRKRKDESVTINLRPRDRRDLELMAEEDGQTIEEFIVARLEEMLAYVPEPYIGFPDFETGPDDDIPF